MYDDSNPAGTTSEVYVSDVKGLLAAGQKVLECFRDRGVERDSLSDADFQDFIRTLYTSGMVMTDFDGNLFYSGPGRLIENPLIAPVMMSCANQLTIRMYLHTMARGYRACLPGYGFPLFAQAFKSGGLKAMLDRLAWLCEVAETSESKTLYAGSEIDDDD